MINVDLIYPIGSIYLSLNDTNPNKIFGGTWERIKGNTLVGVDESDIDFKTSKLTGGEKTHKLTISEMPSHTHGSKTYGDGGVSTKGGGLWGVTKAYGEATNQYPSIYETGGDKPHNNMPPYFTCFIWYRTA